MKNEFTVAVIITCWFCSSNIVAQQFSTELGKVGEAEISLKKFKPDSLAEAVVLFDIGVTKFYISTDNHIIYFNRKKRIKVLEEAGNNYGEVAILLYNNDTRAEKVTFFEGTSYYPDNGRINKSTINLTNGFDETINDNFKYKKFAFPNVRPGTIIEFSYEVETPFHFNLPDWQFQDRIPTVYSSYEVGMVPFYEYVFVVQGISKFDNYVTKSGKKSSIGTTEYADLDHKFEMVNVPAFRDESYITSINDYIMKIDFQLSKINHYGGGIQRVITTWPELSNELLNYPEFGGYIKRSGKYAKKMLDNEITLKQESLIGKAHEIIDFAKRSFKWNSRYGKYAAKIRMN
ncbi:MAG: DUF3857 domain-containing protein [Saprospiraceae bacterium]|nr:DUF3857 domain-containing protein [Saprospiraceae bacterium]